MAAISCRGAIFCSAMLALGLWQASAQAAVVLPDNTQVKKVDFERHIMGLFGKMGCNSGSCHGSFQGKGGLRLSLFGYEPAIDYAAITREVMGRRINPVEPDRSLLLLKATGQVEHGGGRRFGVGSWQYQLLREWIVDGAAWQKGSGQVEAITVTPKEQAFKKPGETAQLVVKARFSDGTEENITQVSDFRSNDDVIAEVNARGEVSARSPGDAAIVVGYRGNVLSLRALVPSQAKVAWPKEVTPVNYIDNAVFTKLRRLNMAPSPLAGDAEFLRRVTLDTIGCLPTPEEVRAFLADQDPNKRAKKIDQLLDHPMHAALWATKFCDITGNNTDLLETPQQLKPRRSQMWHDWFRKRLAENVPYDQIVEGVLVATSRGAQEPEEWIKVQKEVDEAMDKGQTTRYADLPHLDLFWRRQQQIPIEQWGEKTAAAFLGVRLECAQCHKHPLDRWTQADYRAYANIFTQVNFGTSPEAKKVIDEENKRRGATGKGNNNRVASVREVYIGNPRNGLNHPDTNATLPPKSLGGPEIKVERGQDQRAPLMTWMRHPDNPFFAKSFVNRIWGHYFGIGIVEPVDDFSQANPPSNEVLLFNLARDFIQHKYDIRHMERAILNSRTYQLSSAYNASNKFDRNFSRSLVRPMMAEVVVDTLNSALGATENLGPDTPPNARAIEVGASRIQNQYVMFMFQIFGRPPRASACDCERAMEPALPQTLFRMTDPSLLSKITSPSNRLQQLLKSGKSDAEVLDELFLATLTRLPTEAEKEHFAKKRVPDRQAAFVDALWALINTREFILNH
jgi:hypothetical protein